MRRTEVKEGVVKEGNTQITMVHEGGEQRFQFSEKLNSLIL